LFLPIVACTLSATGLEMGAGWFLLGVEAGGEGGGGVGGEGGGGGRGERWAGPCMHI
jgi:hypothetical protein